jgi:hypothetical protein
VFGVGRRRWPDVVDETSGQLQHRINAFPHFIASYTKQEINPE